MAALLAGVGLVRTLGQTFAPVLAVLAIVAVGAAGSDWVEHTAPFGLKAQRDRARAETAATTSALHAMQADRDAWKAADGRVEAQRRIDADAAAKALNTAETANLRAVDAAFDQGAAFGRALAKQDAAHATPPVQPVFAAVPAGVRDSADFAAQWDHSAYRP